MGGVLRIRYAHVSNKIDYPGFYHIAQLRY